MPSSITGEVTLMIRFLADLLLGIALLIALPTLFIDINDSVKGVAYVCIALSIIVNLGLWFNDWRQRKR